MKRDHDFEEYAAAKPFFDAFVTLPRLLLENVGKRTGVFLELGAGDGQKLEFLLGRNLLKHYGRVLASDISQARVARMRRRLPTVDAFVADAQSPEIAASSVDFVFSDQVIEHVPSDRAMASAIREVLKPGGLAVIGSVIKHPGGWYFYRVNGEWRLDQTHLREYRSLAEFGALFSSAGLQVRELDMEPVAFPVGDILARIMARLDQAHPNRYQSFYENFPWARRLGMRIRIPRYSLCYALLERSSV